MKYFGVPTCPYCRKRVNLIRTWSLKRQGEYRCPRCGGISNIFLSPLVYVFALLAIFAGGVLYFFHRYVLDDVGLNTILEVMAPFAAFFLLSLFLVYLERPVIKTVSRSTGKVRRLRARREEPFDDVVQPRRSDTAQIFADEDEYLPKMEYRTGVLPVNLRDLEQQLPRESVPQSPEELAETRTGPALAEQEEIYRRAEQEARARREQAEEQERQERERQLALQRQREAEEAERLRREAEAAEQARQKAEAEERLRREQEAAEAARLKREAEEAARARREAEKAERARRNAELAAQREQEAAQTAQQRREAYEAKQEADRQARAQRQQEAALAAQRRREEAERRREAEQAARLQRQQEAAQAAQRRREEAEQRREAEQAARAQRMAERAAENRQASAPAAGSGSWEVVRPRHRGGEDLATTVQENLDSIDELLKELQK